MSLFGLTEEQIEVVLEYCNNKNIIDYIVNKLNISQKVNNEEDFFELVILCADRYSSAEVDVLSHLEANKYDKSKTQPIYINDTVSKRRKSIKKLIIIIKSRYILIISPT